MPEKTLRQLRDFGMKNLAEYYELQLKEGDFSIVEVGSSSTAPEYAECCEEIRQHMKRRHGIHQRGEAMNGVWQAMGDPSEIFYFGGLAKHNESCKPITIDVKTYIEILAADLHSVPLPTIQKFDEMCEGYLIMERAIASSN